jgi:hypothetical protein
LESPLALLRNAKIAKMQKNTKMSKKNSEVFLEVHASGLPDGIFSNQKSQFG